MIGGFEHVTPMEFVLFAIVVIYPFDSNKKTNGVIHDDVENVVNVHWYNAHMSPPPEGKTHKIINEH